MLLSALFLIYFALLFLYVVVFGFNHYRIQAKFKVHPSVITLLLPFILNFLAAKTIFDRLNPFLTTLLPCLLIYFLGKKIQKVIIFGLTGGIACGKSTLVSKMVQTLSDELYVIDCDKINRQLSQKGNAGYDLILSMLGDRREQYLLPNKQINRPKFSDYVFNNPQFRKQLTKKMGRKILWRIIQELYGCVMGKKKLVLIDAPILYQTKYLQYICYPIIVVGCPPEIQIKRLVANRGLPQEQARNRINSQMPLQVKKKKADIYVENNSTPDEMFTNTLKKLNKILATKKR